MPERMPNFLASYDAEATTPLSWGSPPTITGLCNNDGSSACSTDTKKASRSMQMYIACSPFYGFAEIASGLCPSQ